ncbi:uncharacterized protein [Musca autumnalis]|uniref:uncharacterized protein n=1 Tax=Musca autumnalis TaxID=221902 RepID=UPI003CE7E5C7
MQKIYKKKDLRKLCRACIKKMRKHELLVNNIHNMDVQIREWLNDPTIKNPAAEDKYPAHVCKSCFNKLEKLLDFYKMCRRSIKFFNEILQKKPKLKAEVTEVTSETEVDNYVETTDKTEWLEFDFVALPGEEEAEDCQEGETDVKEEEVEEEKADSIGLSDDDDNNITETLEDSVYSAYIIKEEVEETSSDVVDNEKTNKKKSRKLKTNITKGKPRKPKDKSDEPIRRHVCEECGKEYKTIVKLKEHQYIHRPIEEYPFHCDEPNCGKAFRSSCGFQDHKLRHAGIKNFQCHLCDMRKTSKKELNIHINYHTKEKKFICPKCSAVFYSANDMRNHDKVVHLKIRRFTCSYCNHQFAKKYALKIHEMRHTGEKPYVCNECGKGFIQMVSMRTHMKTHYNDDGGKCNETKSYMMENE